MSAQPLIDVHDLERTFDVRRRVEGRRRRVRDQVVAVHDLTFSVDAGEMVGYIGPNGAGKSTTIKMLTGILVPTRGEVRVGGLDPSRQRVELARRIGTPPTWPATPRGSTSGRCSTCRCGSSPSASACAAS